MSNEKIRYIVKPSDQYPMLVDNRLIDRIETAIAMYMKNQWSSNLH
ncbi:hypothetical protein ACS78V_20885 [Yersinia enterocolitica]|nr:hypothetical protein [Yersinia enterocolitica]